MQIKKRLYLEWQCILQQILLHIQPIVINGTWYSITHAINEKKGQYKKNEADNSKFVPERFDMAYRAERNTLYRYQGKRSDVAVCHDFHAANDPDKYYPSNPAFKVKRISKYGTQVHLSDANVIAHFATINYN